MFLQLMGQVAFIVIHTHIIIIFLLLAVSPNDYTALVSQQLTFTSGQSSSGDNTQCFDVGIVVNSFQDGPKSFTVHLNSSLSSVMIHSSSSSAIVEIDQPPATGK